MNKKLYIGSLMSGIFLLATVVAPVGAQGRSEEKRQIREDAAAQAEQRQEDRDERKAEIEQRVAERQEQVATERCEQRQAVIERIIPRLANGANTVFDRIDSVYMKIVGFYEDGQLTVSNYEELVDAIELSRANAEEAVAVIGEFEFELDCEENGVGQQLDGYRTAIAEARDELKLYRADVVELISSLRAEAAESDDQGDTEEETETESESEVEVEDESENENENESGDDTEGGDNV